tara:strand:+ start:285 stop:1358 length:1074 start_codon:yes stop_codon:yes gene_type:complete
MNNKVMAEVNNMPSMDFYIRSARPKSADSSVAAYSRIIKKFMDHKNFDENSYDQEWVQDIEWIDEKINSLNLKPTTERNYYVALMIITEGYNGGKYSNKWENLPEYLHFSNKTDELNKDYNNKVNSNNGLTESQAENLCSVDEIVAVLNKLTPNIRSYRAGLDWSSGPGAINKSESDTFMAYVLVSLYLELPLRNELASLIFITKRDMNAVPMDERQNYFIDNGKEGAEIIRYKYKTVAKHGPITIKLDKPLTQLLRTWIKYRNISKKIVLDEHNFIFPDLQAKKGSTSSTAELNLTKNLNRFFILYLGKKISTTLLAKITTRDKVDPDTLQALALAATRRGTSMGVIANIYTGIAN